MIIKLNLDDQEESYIWETNSSDGCRIWDQETGESLDKDRFRKDLGDVVESYQIVAHKLGMTI